MFLKSFKQGQNNMKKWRKRMKIGFFWYLIKKIGKSYTRLFWGEIFYAIGLALTGYAQYLTSYIYNTPENPSTTPFYVAVFALLLVFLAMVLVLQGIVNRSKQTPSQNTPLPS